MSRFLLPESRSPWLAHVGHPGALEDQTRLALELLISRSRWEDVDEVIHLAKAWGRVQVTPEYVLLYKEFAEHPWPKYTEARVQVLDGGVG